MTLNLTKNFDGLTVRMAGTAESPLFCAADVCAVLGYTKYRDAVALLDEDERVSSKVDTLGGKQEMTFVTESGLYHLIFKSRKASAKKFRRWVTEEVLPSIRKDGFYLPTTSSTQALADRADCASEKVLKMVDQLILRGVPPQAACGAASNVFRDAVKMPSLALPSANTSITP